MQNQDRQQGFTLVEAMISLSFFLIVLFAIYTLFETSTATYSKGTHLQDVQQAARLALDEISNQIRMANYYPELFDTNPPGTPGCPTGTAGPCDTTSSPIHLATPTALAVFGNLDGCRDGSNNLRSRVFLYCLNGQQLIAKAAVFQAGASAPYTCTNNTGDVLVSNVAAINFAYFDANGAQINAPVGNQPGQPLDNQDVGNAANFASTAQRDTVRKILVTLRVSEQLPVSNGGPGGQQTQDYLLTSVIRVRNMQ